MNKHLAFQINLRYFIQFSYLGTHYHGWQQQPNAVTVQEVLNLALSTVLNAKIDCMGAGRTDTGVHAREMFAHFDTLEIEDSAVCIHKLNSFLPKDIVVKEVFAVHPEAHARFDAQKRTYEYHINTFKDPFVSDQSWYFPKTLDLSEMNKACEVLRKHTDFQCFSKVNTDVNTFNCTIFEASWEAKKNHYIFTITADRFLRNMVRAMVGTLINVGLYKITLDDFITIIESKDRTKAGFSVPAHGLFLTQIEYPYLKKK